MFHSYNTYRNPHVFRQSVSKKEPSGSDNVVSKSTSSSDNEILEHSDSESNSAEYEADTVKKRKRKSSDNDVREAVSYTHLVLKTQDCLSIYYY